MLETVTSPMVMLTVVDAEPTELLAQTVNTAPVTTCVGVPQMVPLLASKVSPLGGVALMAHVVMPPVVPLVETVGVAGVIAKPTVPEMSA